MNTYLLVHRHPPNYTGDADTFAAWEAWFRELGDAVVDLGNPVLDDRGHTGDTGKAPRSAATPSSTPPTSPRPPASRAAALSSRTVAGSRSAG
jgi:hypothetical protein